MMLNKKTKSIIGLSLLISSAGIIAPNLVHANSDNNSTIHKEESVSPRGYASGDIVGFIGTGWVSNVKFYGQAFVNTSNGNGTGKATITSSTPVSAGRLGVSASLFDENLVLLESTPYKYNTVTTTSHTAQTRSQWGGPKYRGGGAVRCTIAQSDYITKSLSRTSAVSAFSLKSLDMLKDSNLSDEEIKEREYMLEEKNMVAAKATNGMIGYISIDDYEDDEILNAKSVEEILKIQSQRTSGYSRAINVYDKDNNIIGEFIIANGEDVK